MQRIHGNMETYTPVARPYKRVARHLMQRFRCGSAGGPFPRTPAPRPLAHIRAARTCSPAVGAILQLDVEAILQISIARLDLIQLPIYKGQRLHLAPGRSGPGRSPDDTARHSPAAVAPDTLLDVLRSRRCVSRDSDNDKVRGLNVF